MHIRQARCHTNTRPRTTAENSGWSEQQDSYSNHLTRLPAIFDFHHKLQLMIAIPTGYLPAARSRNVEPNQHRCGAVAKTRVSRVFPGKSRRLGIQSISED